MQVFYHNKEILCKRALWGNLLPFLTINDTMKVILEKKAAKYLESLDTIRELNMGVVAVRKKLHTFIDKMPDYCLSSVEPILSYLASESAIETNLTSEEKIWVAEGRKQYKTHPKDFVSLDSIK